MITAHLHATLQRQTPSGPLRRLDVTLPPQSALKDLLEALAVRVESDAILLVVNGRLVSPDHVLGEGDEVHLFPALSGGAGMTGSREVTTGPGP